MRLKRACERAKIKLSSFPVTKIHVKNYLNYKGIDFKITKEEFLTYCQKLFNKFQNILYDFIEQSKVNKNDISEVILIGGSNLIPEIRNIVAKTFNNPKTKIQSNLDPKEVVAMGAAIRGGKISNLPSVSDIILFDVTNLSIGIKLEGNIFHKMIPRSKPIPYNTKEIFYTVYDNQTSANIEIFEGEIKNDCNLNNFLLGKFMIYGLPKRKKGEVEIEVSIHIKENSILEVTATQNDNKINSEKLTIKKVNDLPEIMNKLKQRGDIIIFFEDEKYNKVKLSIIEFEEGLRKLKSKKEKNDENFKSIYKSLIEYLGGFLIKCIDISNLYILFLNII